VEEIVLSATLLEPSFVNSVDRDCDRWNEDQGRWPWQFGDDLVADSGVRHVYERARALEGGRVGAFLPPAGTSYGRLNHHKEGVVHSHS